MVAVHDFGVREREQIVRLAIWHGWIFKAEQHARGRGVDDPVVVLTAVDAIGRWHSPPPRNRKAERLQRRAGCKRFTIGTVPYAELLKHDGGEQWQEDMEDMRRMRRKGGTLVICINRTGHFLAAVSPEISRQPRGTAGDALEHDADHE